MHSSLLSVRDMRLIALSGLTIGMASGRRPLIIVMFPLMSNNSIMCVLYRLVSIRFLGLRFIRPTVIRPYRIWRMIFLLNELFPETAVISSCSVRRRLWLIRRLPMLPWSSWIKDFWDAVVSSICWMSVIRPACIWTRPYRTTAWSCRILMCDWIGI